MEIRNDGKDKYAPLLSATKENDSDSRLRREPLEEMGHVAHPIIRQQMNLGKDEPYQSQETVFWICQPMQHAHQA